MQFVTAALSTAAPNATKPPTEFRIFRKGINTSSKGDFVFDAAAAKSVMAAFNKANADLPIDLEHSSIDASALAQRSDAGDARGWLRLAVRDGELWAVNVSFTADGAERLASRKQRYFSPTFTVGDGGRVAELYNVALVAAPALHDIEPLAAGKFARRASTTVAARITLPQAQAFRSRCAALGKAPGVVLRHLLVHLAAIGDADPNAVRADVCTALGLDPETSDRAAVVQAISDLFAELESSPDALAEVADQKPPKPGEAPQPLARRPAADPHAATRRSLAPYVTAARQSAPIVDPHRTAFRAEIMSRMDPIQQRTFLALTAQRDASRAALKRK